MFDSLYSQKKYHELNRYNEQYAITKHLETLNGYDVPYREIIDYKLIVYLIRKINEPIFSCYDAGCGSGLLLKYIREECGDSIVPFGCDCNELAIEVLKREVFPQFQSNFEVANFLSLKSINTDLCICMLVGKHRDFINNTINSKYIVARSYKEHSEKDEKHLASRFKVLEKREGVIHDYYLVSSLV